jgi:site-specific DNA-methyltransferase (adenine-specific)
MNLNTIECADLRIAAMDIPDESVDMIFTDPPYNRSALDLYGYLAEIGSRVLKKGGFCLAMSGGLYQDDIHLLMSQHMNFYWTFHVSLTGSYTGAVHPGGNHKPIITRVKPIHAYVKGWGEPRTVIYDPFAGDGNDKRFHHWGQDEKSARYYIDCFTRPGDLVLDPFCGGGTTPMVCKALERNWLACDLDPVAVETARARVRNPWYVPERDQQMAFDFAQ